MSVTAQTKTHHDQERGPTLINSYAGRRAEKRRLSRNRSYGRVLHPVKVEEQTFETLEKRPSSLFVRYGKGLWYAVLAIGLHGGLVFGISSLSGSLGKHGDIDRRIIEKVTVRVVDKPPLDRESLEPAAQEKKEEEKIAALQPETPVEKPVERKKMVAKAGPKRTKNKAEPEVQADPVDFDGTAQNDPGQKPKRRVVGLSFESTVKGGEGPSFAVGNTRMGQTESRAADPKAVGKLAAEEIRVGERDRVGSNRVAAAIPSSRTELTRPKRISDIALQYPRTLKDQGIEGNVVVLIRVSSEGSVTRVKVLKSSGYPEFDEAARQAATSERFSPATRDGEPVDYNLKYTYRFRIRQA